MKVALYMRVSTKEQIENYSLSNQEDKLRAFCKAKDYEVYDIYKDGGYSGASTDRPDLIRLINDIKQKKINVVMVYKLDRLSRSQKDTLELIEMFNSNNVEFVSVTESLDTSTPMGRAMTGIMSAFAQLERELIAERMRDGQVKRAMDGYASMGGDYDPAGYKRQDGELVTIEHEKEHIKEAFNLYIKYHSITKVQRELKMLGYPVWRFRRYRDILENPLYNGKVTYAGVVYDGRQEKFIDDDTFNEVQRLLKRHRGHNYHRAKESLLSGLMTCSWCGENYVAYSVSNNTKAKTVYRYYMCRARRFPNEYDEKCMNKNWKREELEGLIEKELQLITAKKEMVNKPKIDYTQQINNINAKIERMIDLYANAEIDTKIIDKKINEFNKEKKELIKRQNEETEKVNIESIEDYVIDFERVDFATKRAIIEKFINRIYLDNTDVSIDWMF